MGKIRILPDLLASKIAAGEVVERPASVVKELVENALDAGGRRIHVEVELGGKKLVRVTDDGEGMTRDDALLAFERHATSKIASVEDLERITTLGFRGEALPSIASVARILLRTKAADDLIGTEVEIEGGKIKDVRDCAWAGGTEVCVRDLFYNVPARRKFLRSDATELFHITNLVTHYALCYPSVAFRLQHGGRTLLEVTPVQTARERAYQVFGEEFLSGVVELDHAHEGIRVFGFASKPNWGRTTREAQYFFVNGRYVRDRVLSQALSESYRTLVSSSTHPAAILFVELSPSDVDVNVHPTKIEVRFRRPASVHAAIVEAVRRALERARPIVEVRPAARRAGEGLRRQGAEPALRREAFRLQAPLAPLASRQPSLKLTFSPASASGASLGRSTPPESPRGGTPSADRVGIPIEPEAPVISPQCLARPSLEAVAGEEAVERIRVIGQFRQSFIIAATDHELLLIDQHAAHERILFERFRERLAREALPGQPLLVPEIVEVTPAQHAVFESVRDELMRMGMDVEVFSGRALALTTLPADVPVAEARALLLELLEIAGQEKRASSSLERLRDRLAASLACRAAVKIHTPLTEAMMHWLVEELFRASFLSSCPHGRPVVVRFTLREIERLFHR
jgi:DNA mismatch repair protein MutL